MNTWKIVDPDGYTTHPRNVRRTATHAVMKKYVAGGNWYLHSAHSTEQLADAELRSAAKRGGGARYQWAVVPIDRNTGTSGYPGGES